MTKELPEFQTAKKTYKKCGECRSASCRKSSGPTPAEGTQQCNQCKNWCDKGAFDNPETDRQFKTCPACRAYHRDYARMKTASAPEGTKYCGGGCGKHLPIADFTDETGRQYSRCLACYERRHNKKNEQRDDGTKYCSVCNSYRADFSGPVENCVYNSCARCRGYQKTYQKANKEKINARRQAKLLSEDQLEDKTKQCTKCCKVHPVEVFHGANKKVYNMCSSCREFCNQNNRAQNEKRRAEEPPEGMALCISGRHFVTVELMYDNYPDGQQYSKCATCRARCKEQYKCHAKELIERSKIWANTPKGKVSRIKACAKDRNIPCLLTDKDALAMVQAPCFYCGRRDVAGRINGIDRKCSSGPYSTSNCVPCCWPCNDAKGGLDPTTFVKRMTMLHALQTGAATENTAVAALWGHTNSGGFGLYSSNAKQRNKEFDLTKARFCEITSQPCVFCRRSSGGVNGRHGLDRIDGDMGYVEGNVESCCRECNFMRGTLSVDEFLQLMERVATRAADVLAVIPFGIVPCLRVQNFWNERKRKHKASADESTS